MPVPRPLVLAIATAVLLGAALPAAAETIHLKNGVRVRGKIVKEDPRTFTVDTPQGRRKVRKDEIALVPPPDPLIASLVGIVPGAGQLYVGDYARGAFFFGLGAATGAAGYFATRQIRPTSPSTAMVTAIVVAALPAMFGSWDAHNQALAMAGQQRFRIDYDD